MNGTSTGNKLEKFYSSKIHKNDVPLLLSSLVLREYRCGQVDLACFKSVDQGCLIELYEIKCSNRFGNRQLKRLMNTKLLLTNIFSMSVLLKLVSGR